MDIRENCYVLFYDQFILFSGHKFDLTTNEHHPDSVCIHVHIFYVQLGTVISLSFLNDPIVKKYIPHSITELENI